MQQRAKNGNNMMRISSWVAGSVSAFCMAGLAGAAWAQDALQGLESVGKPLPGKMGFQPAVTEISRDLQWLDHALLLVCAAIVLFVTALLIYVSVRYNQKSNPKPAAFTHNTMVEVTWTVVPIIILVFIGAFSLPILFKEQIIPTADLTIKATGHQWYWSYEYPDEGIAFDAFLVDGSIKVASLGADQPMSAPEINSEAAQLKLKALGYAPDEFLLATDNAVVIPVNKIVVVQVTGADVIHSWKVPAFGVMQDAVPGRLAELWFKAEKEGVYFGQCSEVCGKSHAYMPITVKVVSQAQYDAWLLTAKQEFASGPAVPAAISVAANN